MSIKKGDNLICIKERIDGKKSCETTMHFKVNKKYKMDAIPLPNHKGMSYWVADGSGYMQQFDDGVEPGDYRHPNLWEFFITEKESLNKKFKKIKNV